MRRGERWRERTDDAVGGEPAGAVKLGPLAWAGLTVGVVVLSGIVFALVRDGGGTPRPSDPRALAPLGDVPVPLHNPITPEKVELGRLLYFDPRLSADGSMSCNSCHPSDQGWAVPAPVSFGPPGTSHWRNVQSILNVGYYTSFNWDGARKSIEQQNSGAWTGAVAGNVDPPLAEERLAQVPEYVKQFRDVFGTPWPRWEDALRAVATYQRTIVSENVPFDAYLEGDGDAISAAAKRGLDLFEGQAGCVSCHNGPLLSDNGFHALGVPENEGLGSNPLQQITFRYQQRSRGVSEDLYRTVERDLGFYYVTKQERDKGKFRTPGLRDLCYTAPYMHNGLFSSLDEVVEFYNDGEGVGPNLDPAFKPLGLSEGQRADLVAFLESLCGDEVTDEAPELPAYRGRE